MKLKELQKIIITKENLETLVDDYMDMFFYTYLDVGQLLGLEKRILKRNEETINISDLKCSIRQERLDTGYVLYFNISSEMIGLDFIKKVRL